MKTVTTAQMKQIDHRAIYELGIPSLELMEHAAQAAADAVRELVPEKPDAPVLAVCGTGNNGGDGLACARLLLALGLDAAVMLVGDPQRLTPDAAENLKRFQAVGGKVLPYSGQPLPQCCCIVDALFGFGLNREVTGLYLEAIEAINAADVPVVACDIPSGLSGDTGLPMGTAVRASRTITFTCAKEGLVKPEAAPYTGRLIVAQIGIPESLL